MTVSAGIAGAIVAAWLIGFGIGRLFRLFDNIGRDLGLD